MRATSRGRSPLVASIIEPAGHSVHVGNPSDIELLRPAIQRITKDDGVPKVVTADRGD